MKSRSAVGWLRVALATGLLGILLTTSTSPFDADPISVDNRTDVPSILAGTTPPPLFYDQEIPPGRALTAHLSVAAARGVPVRVEIPPRAPRLFATGPNTLVAGRRGSIWFRAAVRRPGEENDTIRLRLTDGVGLVDTLELVAGTEEYLEGSIPVETSRPGAASWTLSLGSDSVTLSTWVQPAVPLKVLVLAGPPSWESRFLIRALEAAGAELTIEQRLGRGLTVSGPRSAGDPSLPRLHAYDILVLGAEARSDDPSLAPEAIGAWVAEDGGGVLILGGSGQQATHTTQRLVWSGPPEILSLPNHDFSFLAGAVTSTTEAHNWITSSDGSSLATLEFAGRGRIARINLETWPWVMEAGLAEAHQRFWETTLEWLAGGVADQLVEGPTGFPGLRWTGRWYRNDGTRWIDFVPAVHGAFPVAPDSAVGILVPDPSTSRMTWQQASLAVGGAGGEIVDRSTSTLSLFVNGRDRSRSLRLLAFLVLGTLAVAGWTIRRLSGLS